MYLMVGPELVERRAAGVARVSEEAGGQVRSVDGVILVDNHEASILPPVGAVCQHATEAASTRCPVPHPIGLPISHELVIDISSYILGNEARQLCDRPASSGFVRRCAT